MFRPKLVLLTALLICSGACDPALAKARAAALTPRASYLGDWTGSAVWRPSDETKPVEFQILADQDPGGFIVTSNPPLRFVRGELVPSAGGKPTGECGLTVRPTAGTAQLEGEFLILTVTTDAAWKCPGAEAQTGEARGTYTMRRTKR